MHEREFIDGSREVWERLASSVRSAREGSVADLGAHELHRMHEDYRQTAADLAYAQTHFPHSRTTLRLNRLVGLAHAELYGAAPHRLAAAWRFLAAGWPRLVRRNWRPLALSASLLFGAMAAGFVISLVDYPLARLFLPELIREGLGDGIERGRQASDLAASAAPLLSAAVTANNIQASLMAFAGGMTFGTLTAFSLVANGLLLGTLAGAFSKAGEALTFWSLIVPHGALELPAVLIAGSAGLMLARALLAPGDLPRATALKRVSGDAARVMLGALPLLMAAGVVEGFFTPSAVDPLLKVAFGGAAFTLLAAYVALPGRGANAK